MNDLNRFLQDRVRMRIFVGMYLAIVLVLYTITHTPAGLRIAGDALYRTPYGERIRRKNLALHGSPVEQALVNGQIRAGDSVAAVKAEYGFAEEIPLGRYTRICPGRSNCGLWCVLYAKDGSLVLAISQFWGNDLTYFDALTRNEWEEMKILERQYYEELQEARRDAPMAVAGFAAISHPDSPAYVRDTSNPSGELP